MKRNFIFILLAFCTLSVNAQKIKVPKDFSEKYKALKNKTAKTQDGSTDVQDEILADGKYDRLAFGMFVLKQEYQIKDNVENVYYGFGGNDEFGTIYSVGFIYKGCYCISNMGYRPWEYDGNFEQFKDEYEPVYYKTSYMMLSNTADNSFSEVDFSAERENAIELLPNSTFIFTTLHARQTGYQIDDTENVAKGTIVWVAKDGNNVFNTITSSFTPEDAASVPVEVPSDDVIGGIYFHGNEVKGIINKNGDEWVLDFPFVGIIEDLNKEISDSSNDGVNENPSKKLTPSKNR